MMLASSTTRKATNETSDNGSFERYAIYYAPRPGSVLAHFGESWFGWSYDDSVETVERSYFGIDKEIADRVTKAPSRYGLHGTLKAPFRISRQMSEASLRNHMEKFASHREPFTLDGLRLAKIGSFLALCPIGDLTRLNHLATQCLIGFEAFRAPLTKEDRARHNPSYLPLAQRLNLELWGYPYVLGEFQFHITLTGNLSDREISEIKPILTPALKDVCSARLEIDAISLMGDPGKGKAFQLLARYPLG